MKVNLPVSMFPMTSKASIAGGLVVAVIIGLALYTAAQQKTSTTDINQGKN